MEPESRPVVDRLTVAAWCALVALEVFAAATDAFGDAPRIETPHAAELPAIPEGGRLIVTHCYTLALDPETRLAAWCAYRVTPAAGETRNRIERNWSTVWTDEALEADDYTGSKYQRGHLVAVASFKASPFCWECHRTEAVIPQTPELNAGPWLALENRVRSLASARGSVDVVCGPAFLQTVPRLPQADEPHRVPSHCWARITAGGETEAYLFPQRCRQADPLATFAVPPSRLDEFTRP
jgi:endonuclease G